MCQNNRILEKKRKELENKNKLLKDASINKRFSQLIHSSISNDKGMIMKHNSFMYQKTSGSKGIYSSKNSVYKNYWKNKTAKFPLSKMKSVAKNSALKRSDRYISKPYKIDSSKTMCKERKKSNTKESISINTQLYESFSK